MSQNRFAILQDYPDNGPEMPQREKVKREKDKHDPGTGRRDKEKRQGRGPSNWGNPMDDVTHPAVPDAPDNAEEQGENQQQPEQQPVKYVAAAQFFESSDDDDVPAGVPAKPTKKAVEVPERYANLIAEKKKKQPIQIQTENDDEDNGPETGFLSTQEAIQQRRENFESRPRGRGRRGRGGRGNYHQRPSDGENRPRGGHPGQRGGRGQKKFQHYEDLSKQQQAQQGQAQEGGEERRNNRGPRDRVPGNVQHQRDNQNRRGPRQQRQDLNLKNFPSL